MPACDLRDHIARDLLVSPETMSGTCRSPQSVIARAVLIGVLRERGHSTGVIGRIVNRDHTTVMHSLSKLPEYLKASPRAAQVYAELLAREAA
jgi:chromosomal replication initiation ATPase DnaA